MTNSDVQKCIYYDNSYLFKILPTYSARSLFESFLIEVSQFVIFKV